MTETVDASALQELGNDLDAFVPVVMDQCRTPGISVALRLADGTTWASAYGSADLTSGTPMTPGTTVRAGSMSKPYTATAVMQLVESGVIGLDEPIGAHLPFPVVNPLGNRDVTVLDLLTHRSGLAGDMGSSSWEPVEPLAQHLAASFIESRYDVYGGRFGPKWSAPVGETYQYCNTGVALLGLLVELTNPDGLSFADYVGAKILDPLGMAETVFAPVHEQAVRRADLVERLCTGYVQLGPLRLPTPTVHIADWPCGTVLTTPRDHLRLLVAFLNGGQAEGCRILGPGTVQSMLTRHVDTLGGGVGLIWNLSNQGKEHEFFAHGGAHMYGWTNTARAYPCLGLAVVVSVNQWNLLEDPGAPRYLEAEMIADYVVDRVLLSAARSGAPGPGNRARKASLLMGVVLAERWARLGLDQWPSQFLAEMIASAHSVSAGQVGWNAGALREGFEAFLSRPSPDQVVRWMVTQPLLPAEELRSLLRDLGCLADNPILPAIPLRQVAAVLAAQ